MAKYRKRVSGRCPRQKKDWRLIASIIVGAVIVLAGVGLVLGITLGDIGGVSAASRCTTLECCARHPGWYWCSIDSQCWRP